MLCVCCAGLYTGFLGCVYNAEYDDSGSIVGGITNQVGDPSTIETDPMMDADECKRLCKERDVSQLLISIIAFVTD